MNRQSTLELQRTLNNWLREQGLPPLKEDGVYGQRTAAAYELMLMRSEAGGVDEPLPVPSPAAPWWTSRAIWGALGGLVAGVLGVVGWTVDAEQLSALLTALGTVIAAAMALYGSIKRKAPIDQTLGARFRGDDVRLPARGVQRPGLPTERRRSGPDSGFAGDQD